MSGAETNELAHTLAERHRRLAMARSTDSPVAGFTRARSRRADMRVLARFPIAYRESEAEFKDGKAGDVSAGGLLMTCDEKLTPGDLELRFTLPSMALEIYPQETHSIDLRKHPTTPLRSEAGRPFEEMHIGGRIVMHRRLGLGKYVYGLAFMAIDTYQREEIARYVHAVDLAHHHH